MVSSRTQLMNNRKNHMGFFLWSKVDSLTNSLGVWIGPRSLHQAAPMTTILIAAQAQIGGISESGRLSPSFCTWSVFGPSKIQHQRLDGYVIARYRWQSRLSEGTGPSQLKEKSPDLECTLLPARSTSAGSGRGPARERKEKDHIDFGFSRLVVSEPQKESLKNQGEAVELWVYELFLLLCKRFAE